MPDQKEMTPRKEKNMAALTSVIAAVGLTTFKIIVGIFTGSLGILAEAAHSALDLVAALVTLFAVRVSSKDPDKEHPYGHGKVENLSALFETLLLLGTCAWIIYEAISRLTGKAVQVDITIWAFIVMLTSIVIDFSRSRVLYRAAKKHNSQALEADALHFSTDIWSSCVVILGLLLVKISEWVPGLKWLEKADSVAALGVSAIVIYVSVELGIRTIQGLLDSPPDGMDRQVIGIIQSIDGVKNVHKVRIRMSGPSLFADVHIRLNPRMTVEKAHEITEKIQKNVRAELPNLEVTVHVEPEKAKESSKSPLKSRGDSLLRGSQFFTSQRFNHTDDCRIIQVPLPSLEHGCVKLAIYRGRGEGNSVFSGSFHDDIQVFGLHGGFEAGLAVAFKQPLRLDVQGPALSRAGFDRFHYLSRIRPCFLGKD